MSSSLFLLVSTCVVGVRFDKSKVCLWEITVTPQSLLISCFDVNNYHGGTTNVLSGDGFGNFGWMCLFSQPIPFPMVSAWKYREISEKDSKNNIFFKWTNIYIYVVVLMYIRFFALLLFNPGCKNISPKFVNCFEM